MNKLSQTKTSLFFSIILYFCGFFLFLEWLYPIKDITETGGITIFIVFAFYCFLISMFQMKWWIGFLLKAVGLLFFIHTLYFEHSFLSGLWFEQLIMEMGFNIEVLISQDWYNLTPVFRSVLFFVLIWLISYLLHYWFVVMKRVFLFVMLTFIYIAVLDTFTLYEANVAIVRTFIISFMALGIANLMKEMDNESIRFSWIKKTPVWLLPLVGIVLFTSLIGFTAPKFEPQWPDPVPFIQSAAEGDLTGGSGVQKVGYGEDDSRLGGSFIQDHTPVFQAEVLEEHYWRIETKDVYTGKGWEASSEPDYQFQQNGTISLETFSDNVTTEGQEAVLEFQDNTTIEKLIYPYGVDKVHKEDGQFLLDDTTEAIQTRLNDEVVSMEDYAIIYESPSFEMNALRDSSDEDPSSIQERFTQIPENLPERVGELAEEITNISDNRYDQAKAIERYFSQTNGYTYQTTDVPVPKEDEDYVDQFLFDSKVGYCDNFSTSMVVMLRTLDIPARWVKGFTSGEMLSQGETAADADLYEVTNANAHSWVEVYFPDTGWVPFEPTQGFSNLSDFHTDTENNADWNDEDALDATEETEQPEEEPDLPEEESQTTMAENNTAENEFTINWWLVVITIGVMILLAFVLYVTRFRWQTHLLAVSFRRKQDAKTYQKAYHHLLKILEHRGLKKEPDQTLREYAKRIDVRYATDEMGQLTHHFEQLLYKNELQNEKADELTQLWKNLIKRIMG
ncbi:transglutaminase TgpA family protein [Virgibacillus ainsalahensis]